MKKAKKACDRRKEMILLSDSVAANVMLTMPEKEFNHIINLRASILLGVLFTRVNEKIKKIEKRKK